MVQALVHSAGHALRGLSSALRRERNLKIFLAVYVASLLFAGYLRLHAWEWIALLLAGGTFLAVEFLNTALERVVDIVDEHCKEEHQTSHYSALRTVKDIAAAASLVSLGVIVVVVLVILWPHLASL